MNSRLTARERESRPDHIVNTPDVLTVAWMDGGNRNVNRSWIKEDVEMKCGLTSAGKVQGTDYFTDHGLGAVEVSTQKPQLNMEKADSVGKGLFSHIFDRRIVGRALKISLVVGPVLALINHFDLCLGSEITTERIVKISVTFLVPFCVSWYSSAITMMEDDKRLMESGKTTVVDSRND